MAEIVYQLRNLAKDYTTRRVLDIKSLDIFRGEVLAIVGPSGSGKSTLLRLLNFLESPTQGTINFLGVDYNGARLPLLGVRRRVTTVFQKPLLLNRTVWANVVYGLELRNSPEKEQRARQALSQVGLLDASNQGALTLSGGEGQRVSLARAIALQPQVLLLDEPTANLDPHNISKIEDIIKNLNLDHHVTMVVVTHNIFQARRLAQRVAFLMEGKLVEVANNPDFFESPQDERTAAFVRGEMVY
jgi:tungstate transport system ATP-binding protein